MPFNPERSIPKEGSPTSPDDYCVRMSGINKRFPGVVANQDVDIAVRRGTFHAVIGENGAGKSTLLNILYGRYRPDAGQIWIEGTEVTQTLRSPADAIRHGIGLVSQHYALIPALTVLENVMLGAEGNPPAGILRPRQAATKTRELAAQLNLEALDLNSRADRLSVAAQQKVEILKALYRGARILLLDEPTATLVPQEVDSLFALLHALVDQGTTIVFVTHKLQQVITHSQKVTVLRAGRVQGHHTTRNVTEADLLREMVAGFAVAGSSPTSEPVQPTTNNQQPTTSNHETTKPRNHETTPLLSLLSASVRSGRGVDAVREVSLGVGRGEIVGVAGVDGSGQRELSEAIVGLRRLETGQLLLEGADIKRSSVRQRQEAGIGYIPEDRHRAGMILDFSIAENYLLGHEQEALWGGGWALDNVTLLARTQLMVQRYDVRGGTLGGKAPGGALSGGNQQKVVFARAMDSDPRLLVACQPTRGLDVEAARFVYETLRTARAAGMGILLFSLDLEEILLLSDRIAVMFNGSIAGILDREEATPERIGALMTGIQNTSSNTISNTTTTNHKAEETVLTERRQA